MDTTFFGIPLAINKKMLHLHAGININSSIPGKTKFKKMRRPLRNYFRPALSILVILLLFVGSGCKSKKKAMEAANAEKERARIEQQAALDRQKQEELKQREAAEKARLDAEAAAAAAEPAKRLDVYFNAIANSNNVNSANSSINEALSLFASPQTPVLIVISESEGQKDYDKPTRIIDYLNYLKDQKKNINKISDLKFDASGKITEIELTK
ncbi:MAG TPA: nucleoid-structuring protein H-NS [Ohtaekwangia sp.]|nr:nucleoid-structuring protein H-NS [Ohtaekwangia sp.]